MGDINIGGDNYGQIGMVLKDCTNMIQNNAPDERKELLEELDKQVQEMIAKLPDGEQKEEAADNLQKLVSEATSEKPKPRWYDVSAEGLIDASKFAKDFTGNIMGTIGQLRKVIWPGS